MNRLMSLLPGIFVAILFPAALFAESLAPYQSPAAQSLQLHNAAKSAPAAEKPVAGEPASNESLVQRLSDLRAERVNAENPEQENPANQETSSEPAATPTDSSSSEVSSPESMSQPAISPETEQRLAKARQVLEIYRPKMLNTREHGPWETMHAIIAYGVKTQVRQDGPHGEPITAIGWLAFNHPAAGQHLFYARRGGGLGALTGPGLQGHSGQFLAIMAQSRLDRTYPIEADGKSFTIEDLIKYEQDTCQPRSELTFKLISLAHYLDSDATWTSEDGQEWNIQRLIREELAQPINGVACGGTHRLFGLSYAVYQRAKQGKPMVGEFARAKKFISDYHKYTYALQNSDGSFSTDWFKGREAKPDLDRRLQTTGHILEWMLFSTPSDELSDPRLNKAVDYLAGIMLANPNHKWAIGPRGHALHAMAIFDERISHQLKHAAPAVADQESPSTEIRSDETSSTPSLDTSSAVNAEPDTTTK